MSRRNRSNKPDKQEAKRNMTKDKAQSAVTVKNNVMVMEGKVMFSSISEARGFENSTTNRNYSITLKIGKEHAEEVMRVIDEIETKAFNDAIKDLTTVQKKQVQKAAPKYRDIEGQDGEPTGEIRLEFKRKEERKAPDVYDKDRNKLEGKKFIGRESDVRVLVSLIPYKMSNLRGVAYKLESVQILNEVKGSGSGSFKQIDPMEFFTAPVNVDDLF